MMNPSIVNINEILTDKVHYIILSKCCIFTRPCPETIKEDLIQSQFFLDRYEIDITEKEEEFNFGMKFPRLTSLGEDLFIENFFKILDGVMLK